MTTSKKARKKRPLLLSHTRPPLAKKQAAPSLSAKATRHLIRSHHQLLKAREKAAAAGDAERVAAIDAEIAAKGGLESYQLASRTGQSRERGGDSSIVLLEWLRPALRKIVKVAPSDPKKLRVLEIGALSTQNACSKAPQLAVTRIDLHACEPGIQQQDFMQRPLPTGDEERFHVISLSLVLNFVPTPVGRGEMLKRCRLFLTSAGLPPGLEGKGFSPCLFLVLPAACVTNSRYLTGERLLEIMQCLGFELREEKITRKLIYQLWSYDPQARGPERVFRKEEINPGKSRNNFSIVLHSTHDDT
ncbi:hypothetical protein VTN31DRAFT_7346 [Thermomyces dupontii]|uniref:uncharacterized protein n=1 Tax=Talaromyces thermophilus TaxID=28565 RepID=UPI003742DFCC